MSNLAKAINYIEQTNSLMEERRKEFINYGDCRDVKALLGGIWKRNSKGKKYLDYPICYQNYQAEMEEMGFTCSVVEHPNGTWFRVSWE